MLRYHRCWTMSDYVKNGCATNIAYEIYVECACIRKQKEEKIEIFIGTPCQVSAYFLLLCQGQAFREFVGGYTRWCPLLKLYISCNPHSQSIFLPRVSIPCLEPIGADRGGIFLWNAEYIPRQEVHETQDQAMHCRLLINQIP